MYKRQDIVIGTHAHVLLGGGYLGSAYVDYGLGNFAFYDNSPPENASGVLLITAVSYTHLDVYKRQVLDFAGMATYAKPS